MMCCGAIQQSRISKVYYGFKNKNYGFIENTNIDYEYLETEECKLLVQKFFKNRRK